MNRLRPLLLRAAAWLTVQTILTVARVLTGVRPLWIGSAPSRTQRVYFANHGSHGDFVLVWTTLPPSVRRYVRPVAGQDYWLASPLRRFVGTAVFDALLIDRTPPPGAPSPVDTIVAALDQGHSLIFFPEGTRNTTEATLLPFKSGLYRLTQRCPRVEFIPVWIDNIRRVIPKGEWLPVPMACTVSYGAPLALDPAESKEDFLARAAAAMLALRPAGSLA